MAIEQRAILQAQIATLSNEMINIVARQESCEMMVMDAVGTTGNDEADRELLKKAQVGKNTLAMLARMAEVRGGRITELQARLDALEREEKAAAEKAANAGPAETATIN